MQTETAPEPQANQHSGSGTLGLLWFFPEVAFTALGSGIITLGRDADCSVRLGGVRASRLHARIVREGPLYVVVDQASRNGTWINGVRVDDAVLEEGSLVRFGDSVAIVTRIDPKLASSGRIFETAQPGVLVGPRHRLAWQRLVEVSKTDQPVIIEGPTGSGKEVFARALHSLSERDGPFVGVNCAALPETLVEAQLFGHARGAYTGAVESTVGVFEAAHRGTLLLDELVELPLQQQAKLLRAIEEGAVTRLGEARPRKVDVRLVSASQQSLWSLTQAGCFRADLLARLSGATVQLLPLRQRREEIPHLFTSAFVAAGGDPRRITGSFVEALCLQDWPLNIRQLLQVARQAAYVEEPLLTSEHVGLLLDRIHGESHSVPRVGAAHVPKPQDETATALGARRAAWLGRNQRHLDALLAALERSDGNLTQAAECVGISRQRAHRLLTARDQLAVTRQKQE